MKFKVDKSSPHFGISKNHYFQFLQDKFLLLQLWWHLCRFCSCCRGRDGSLCSWIWLEWLFAHSSKCYQFLNISFASDLHAHKLQTWINYDVRDGNNQGWRNEVLVLASQDVPTWKLGVSQDFVLQFACGHTYFVITTSELMVRWICVGIILWCELAASIKGKDGVWSRWWHNTSHPHSWAQYYWLCSGHRYLRSKCADSSLLPQRPGICFLILTLSGFGCTFMCRVSN